MLKKLLLIVLVIWFIASLLRFGDHLIRIATDEAKIIFESDDTKRRIEFGQVYDYIRYIEHNTDRRSSVGIATSNGEYFYLARYYLYPRKVIWVQGVVKLKDQGFHAISVDGSYKNTFLATTNLYSVTRFGDTHIFIKK